MMRLPLCVKMREAPWSAVTAATALFLPSGRRQLRSAALPHSKALRASSCQRGISFFAFSECFPILLLLLLLPACTVGPNYQRPKTDIPGEYRGAPATVPGAASSESLGDAKWWAVFQDERLQSLIRTALEQNYDVRIAAERVLAAQAQLRITRSDQYPSAGVEVGATTEREPVSPFSPSYRWDYMQVGGAASWDIDFWGKYRRATEAARANLAQTEWGRHAVVSTLVANVAAAYFRLRAFDLELDITQRSLASRRESLRLTKLLADQGAASMVDVRQAEQLVYVASATLPDLERQIEQGENYIRLLLAQYPGPITRGHSLTEQVRPPVVPAGLPSQLLERRPDIHEAEQQLIAANAQIGVARAAYFPSISLTGTAGFISSALTELFSKPAAAWDVAASVAQPLYTAAKLQGNVRLAEAQQRQALLAYQQTIHNAFRDVSDALVAYQKTREAREQQELLAAAAQDSARLAHVRYSGGATAYLEVLTNETNYLAAELALSQARLNEMLSLVQIYSALGGGWQQ
ncbi:MAG TPA: efflux transporter outer membrane subunit [Terriglobia bacterium]|nr:efflux transporter outer membrane subunit [Terriglobia bacterium]